ncbi:hypothetical protein NPIL_556971 [Nephila pilipes]|uniref:Uncharacterized protein n=1 Tax=Nephila pilipes TaxID=299642 RepID=A0A8X6PG97_NEPPI|nr:hypothetical protein NPIL_556971 [Nephila pilipes]
MKLFSCKAETSLARDKGSRFMLMLFGKTHNGCVVSEKSRFLRTEVISLRGWRAPFFRAKRTCENLQDDNDRIPQMESEFSHLNYYQAVCCRFSN